MVLSGLLALAVSLSGCATFCDPEDPDAYEPDAYSGAPLSDRESYDEYGRRGVTVTIFDVVDAMQDPD